MRDVGSRATRDNGLVHLLLPSANMGVNFFALNGSRDLVIGPAKFEHLVRVAMC